MQIERKMTHRTYPVFTKSKVVLQKNSKLKIFKQLVLFGWFHVWWKCRSFWWVPLCGSRGEIETGVLLDSSGRGTTENTTENERKSNIKNNTRDCSRAVHTMPRRTFLCCLICKSCTEWNNVLVWKVSLEPIRLCWCEQDLQ